MTLNGVMAVTLRYFTEFGKLALQKTICGKSLLYFVVHVQCRHKESSRSLSHLLKSFLFCIVEQQKGNNLVRNCGGYVDVPGPPGNVRGTDVTNSSCTLSWNAPQYDGGSPVTGYHVEMYKWSQWISWNAPQYDGGSPVTGYHVEMYKWSQWIRMNTTPITACFNDLTDLVKGTKYEFRVCALNAAGVGPPSKSTTIHVTDVPGCPAAPEVTSRTEHEAALTFRAPDNNGGSAITGYIVEMKSSSESTWRIVGNNVTRMKFVATGLKPRSSYEFRVTAVNKAGPGQPSAPSQRSRHGKYESPAVSPHAQSQTTASGSIHREFEFYEFFHS